MRVPGEGRGIWETAGREGLLQALSPWGPQLDIALPGLTGVVTNQARGCPSGRGHTQDTPLAKRRPLSSPSPALFTVEQEVWTRWEKELDLPFTEYHA